MDIIMYLVFLSTGFGLGIVCSLSLFLHRLEKLKREDSAAPAPQVHVNVSAELVARYLDSFNLIAIPKDLVINPDEQVTKH